MKIFLFAIIALFVAPNTSLAIATANAQGCSVYVPTLVDVQPMIEDVVYDRTTPMLKIKQLSETGHQEDQTSSMQSETWPVGLSTGEMFFRVNSDITKMRTIGSSITCGQIKAIHVEFGFKDNKIYVAREFPKRSCPYKEVLSHEEKHKAVDRQIVQDSLEKIERVLTDASRDIGVVRSASSGVVDDEINSALSQAIQKLTKEIETDHNDRQKQVDSKEEYQRVTDSCGGQTMDIVHQRLELLEETHPGSTKAKRKP